MPSWEPLARELRGEGKSLREIAACVGVSAERVRQVLREPTGIKRLSVAGRRGASVRWYGTLEYALWFEERERARKAASAPI